MSASRPNILYVLADDLGQGDVSCFNPHSAWTTPHLDTLAAEGMRFTDSHATSALCTPSRYGLLTGRYNWRSHLKRAVLPGDSQSLIEKGRLTVAGFLREHGYRTAVVGKWHLGLDWQLRKGGNAYAEYRQSGPEDGSDGTASGRPRMGRGGNFDPVDHTWREGMDIDYSQPILHGPRELGFDRSFITAASLDQPPYVYIEDGVPLGEATVYEGHAERLDRRTDSMQQSIQRGAMVPGYDVRRVAQDFQDKALEVLDGLLAGDDPWFLYVPSHLVHGPIIPDEPWQGRSGAGPYGDFVLQFDDYVGQLVERIDGAGAREDTIVIVTSDNGASGVAGFAGLAEHGHDPNNGFRGHKGDIHEGGHREPFIVRWPERIPAGATSEGLVSHADLFATLADVLGQDLPADAAEDSVSELPLWEGGVQPVRRSLVTSSGGGGFSLRDGEWKLDFVTNDDGMDATFAVAQGLEPAPEYVPAQLYHLADDPQEERNLIADHPERVARMTEMMAEQIRRGRSTPGPSTPNQAPTGSGDWPQIGWMPDARRVVDSCAPTPASDGV
jgi:arylsulfatase A